MEPIPEISLKLIPESSKARAVVNGDFGYSEAGNGNKLGGSPDWIQSDETPDCQECGEPMDFYGEPAKVAPCLQLEVPSRSPRSLPHVHRPFNSYWRADPS